MKVNLLGMTIQINQWILIAVVLCLLVAVGTVGFVASRSGDSVIITSNTDELADKTSKPVDSSAQQTGSKEEPEQQKNQNEEIQVYVVGCVKNQGIVTLKKGQMIADAIQAAGGITEDADIANINMVYKLTQNVMLKVKSKNDAQATKGKPPIDATGSKSGETAAGVEIRSDDGGVLVNNSTSDPGKGGGKININTATAEQMDAALPGVGISTANDILSYREKHGPFKKIEDIMKVPGIKENKFNKFKDLITVE